MWPWETGRRASVGFLRGRPGPHQQRGPLSYVLVLGRGLLKRKQCGSRAQPPTHPHGNGDAEGPWDPRRPCVVVLWVSGFAVSVRRGWLSSIPCISSRHVYNDVAIGLAPGFFPNCLPGHVPPPLSLSSVVSLHSSSQTELFCVLTLPANGGTIVLKSGKRVRFGCSYTS